MIRSLRRVAPAAQVWVLCLDDLTLDIFRQISEPGVQPIALSKFESGDPALAAAKADGRSLIEYYFSAKPSLIAHTMRAVPSAEYVTYLDSDLWFFADPSPVFCEAPCASALLTPHRFPGASRERECFGRFNAGWVAFCRSDEGQASLQWWRSRCLEWCFDEVDEANGRFADQRYLDRIAQDFPHAHALQHTGANLAPWNVGGHRLTLRDGAIMVDSADPLLFFHVHGISSVSGSLYITPQEVYRSAPDTVLREYVYRPYIRALRAIDRELAPLMPRAAVPLRQLSRKPLTGWLETVRAYLRIARAFARGALIRVAE